MSSTIHPFLGDENRGMLQRVLYKDIRRRYGGELNEKQASRLIKTVNYWTGEVYRVQGNKSTDYLNKEVFPLVLGDYMGYLERNERSSVRSVMSDMEEGPVVTQTTSHTEVIQDITRMDVGSAFSALQAQRQDTKKVTAPAPNFLMDLRDEGTVSLDIFERIKRDREAEVERAAAAAAAASSAAPVGRDDSRALTLNNFVEATDMFSMGSRKARDDAEAIFADRERKRLEQRASAEMPVPPDMKALILGNNTELSRMNTSAGNPTLSLPSNERATMASLPQAILTKEPDVMAYKESEINLFISSADRDWTVTNPGSQDSRYNFTIVFDPANKPIIKRDSLSPFTPQRIVTPGVTNSISDSHDPNSNIYANPTVATRFRNITRVEFVKAILPGEGLDVFVTKNAVSTYSASLNLNVLSYPYIQVRIPELETNTYGTNQGLNASFAVIQYDANWVNDTNNAVQRGYFAMIPKFLKCQKVYTPTPLATLQKLSFQFQRPDGSVLSSVPDTLDISRIIPSSCISNTAGFIGSTGGSLPPSYLRDVNVDLSGSSYYWIQTNTFFNNQTAFVGDRILIKNINWNVLQLQPVAPTTPQGTVLAQLNDIVGTLENTTGLLVCGVGTVTGSGAGARFTESWNSFGYANAIIVSGKLTDPTITGTRVASSPGGVVDTITTGSFSASPITSPNVFLGANPVTTGRLINLSHQVHIAMRIITRDVDSTGIIRPDNL